MTRTKRLALAFYIGAMAAGAAIGITVDRWILRDQLMEELGNEGSMRKTFADRLRLDSVQRVALELHDRHDLEALRAPACLAQPDHLALVLADLRARGNVAAREEPAAGEAARPHRERVVNLPPLLHRRMITSGA